MMHRAGRFRLEARSSGGACAHRWWLERIGIALLAFAMAGLAVARQSAPAAPRSSTVPSSARGTPPPTQPSAESHQAFLDAADQVLVQMSKILDLPIKHPLKKSLRSRAEIRAYLVKQEKGDKDKAQRYADEKSLEAFGLIPQHFPLDSFMLNLLTDQIAGMYDPKAKEFYIADWIPIDQQREVMAHELTHALEDQSFHIEKWIKAARPNDDAEMARQAVSEGSALAAMIDYTFRDQHVGIRDLPDVSHLMQTESLAGTSKDPILAKAPLYIRDSLLFPYLAGTSFTQQFLKAHTGWGDLKLLFKNPPVSTQQILHPALYLRGVEPRKVTLPAWKKIVPKDWKLLDENVMGEFGLEELLKQFLGADRASVLAPAWAGDRYAVFENSQTGETPLVFRLTLDSDAHAAQFFTAFGDALEKKYPSHTHAQRAPEFFEFQTPRSGVYLRCFQTECLDVERATPETFEAILRAMGWTPPPTAAAASSMAMPGRHHPAPPPSIEAAVFVQD